MRQGGKSLMLNTNSWPRLPSGHQVTVNMHMLSLWCDVSQMTLQQPMLDSWHTEEFFAPFP
jgi:hypothetical protein